MKIALAADHGRFEMKELLIARLRQAGQEVTDFGARALDPSDDRVLCLGGRVMGIEVAWDQVQTFISTTFSGAERHRRRLSKAARLEGFNDFVAFVLVQPSTVSAPYPSLSWADSPGPSRSL